MMPRPEIAILWVLTLSTLCYAGPINRQASDHNSLRLDGRNQSNAEQNVCVNDDVLYQPGDLMPAPTPCARCVCSPPGSLCTPVACEKRPGCKALQRPNQCCPEYQCECEHNGRLYANGERLDNAENPCQACYCQGGEVVCTTVECYRRDDCEPQFVVGRCCPKYDHCPPLVMDEARYDEPFISGDRPQHTRATFQPSSGLEGDMGGELSDEEDDQVLGASNVQERVHIPASDATTDAPTSATDVPAISAASPAGDAPHDAAIKIHVPAKPWTDTIAPATTRAPQTTEEGSGATEADVENAKSGGETVVGITEQVGEEEVTIISTTDDVTTVVSRDELDTTKEDVTETRTEEPITRLFMLSKEAELDPTTVSAEYTDIPDEMSTTPEVSSRSQETTVTQNEDSATEATTLAKESTTTTEASTDSSPEFKDFDESSASKSSEFLRDSSSTGSSGGFPSASDSHSKPSSSASDESTSHFLASSINTESVKPSNDGIVSPHSESTDSNESSDSTEENVTREIVPSTEKENSEETTEKKDLAGTKLVEIDHVTGELKIDEPSLDDKIKDEENKIKKRNEQPDIVLDTEATDENGPPVLLIGDDLANHQMDIIVATSSTEEADTENPHGDEGPELRDNQQETISQSEDEENATDQSETTEQPAKDTDEAGKLDGSEEVDETHTEEPSSAKEKPTTVPMVGSSTEKQAGDVDALMDIMMSDDPLPGQADSAEIAKNEEDLDKILGKTGDKYDDDDDSTTMANKDDGTHIATDPDDDKADDSVNTKIDLQTESPEHESTTNTGENEETVTNTDKEDGETTLEPKYENTVVPDVENLEHKKNDLQLDDNQYGTGDKVIQRRADETGGDNEITDDQTTTETEENFTTTEYSTSEKPIAETVVPNAITEKEQSDNEGTTETKYTETQTEPVDLQEGEQSDTEQKEKSHEEQSKDITTLEYETTTDNPTTQNSPSDKISNFANDDIMLGDQPLSGILAFKMQSTENKEKSATKDNSENVSDKDHTTETEQTTEIEDRVDLVEDTTSTQDQESDLQTEISQTTITEFNTESATTQEQKTETANEAKLKENDADEDSKDKNEENDSDENTQSYTGSDDEPLRILVHSANADKEDESTTLSENTEGHSDEFSTPPPDTTSSDDSVQDESVTTQAEKDSAQEDVTATEGNREEATTDEEEHQTESFDTGVKINPEVLELKPLATVAPKPATNATDAVADHDITTLSPQWLKSDNDTKEEAASGHDAGDEKQEEKEESGASAEVTSGAPVQTVTEHHESEDTESKGENKEESKAESKGESLLEGEGVNDGKKQQRVERRVDETDKKDLFLLEDFFTKLYRHQIATDTNKEH